MQEQHQSQSLSNLLNQLENPEIQESLSSILKKLSEYEKGIESFNNMLTFGKDLFNDQQIGQKYDEILASYNVDFKTIHAIIGLLENLPKLNMILDQFIKIMDFANAILKDKQSIEYVTNNVSQYVEPLKEKTQLYKTFVSEVKEQMKSNENPEPINLFTILKWLKEPAVQNILQYIQVGIHVLNHEKERPGTKEFS